MSKHRSPSEIKSDSSKAVQVAGTRERRKPSGSAHVWTELRGKRPDGPWRPGKTARERRHG